MLLTEGTLTWPYLAACDATTLGLSTGQFQQAVDTGVEWIWSNTARRFGTRPVTYRPQSRGRRVPGWPNIGLQPVDSGYYNLTTVTEDWAPETDQILELPGPVVSVESVVIEGAALDPAAYRLDGGWLVRQDGGFWPRTQNLIAALGAVDTWAVNYTRGRVPSTYGQYATGLLICYLAKQLASGRPCAVPYNTTSVSRAGVTIQRDATKGAMTSPVPEVDSWVAMVNPRGLMEEPKVWSPDIARNRRPYAGSYDFTTAPQGMSVGDITALADFLVLGPTQPVPPGTPAGTVIFRTE